MARAWRRDFSAAIKVVPDPAKASSTISPRREQSLMASTTRATGMQASFFGAFAPMLRETTQIRHRGGANSVAMPNPRQRLARAQESAIAKSMAQREPTTLRLQSSPSASKTRTRRTAAKFGAARAVRIHTCPRADAPGRESRSRQLPWWLTPRSHKNASPRINVRLSIDDNSIKTSVANDTKQRSQLTRSGEMTDILA
jgi:hypothetical protein